MKTFIYKMSWWSELDEKVIEETGLIYGETYGKAADQIVSSCTAPSGECNLISINLEEIDNMNGAISKNDILEIFKEG